MKYKQTSELAAAELAAAGRAVLELAERHSLQSADLGSQMISLKTAVDFFDSKYKSDSLKSQSYDLSEARIPSLIDSSKDLLEYMLKRGLILEDERQDLQNRIQKSSVSMRSVIAGGEQLEVFIATPLTVTQSSSTAERIAVLESLASREQIEQIEKIEGYNGLTDETRLEFLELIVGHPAMEAGRELVRSILYGGPDPKARQEAAQEKYKEATVAQEKFEMCYGRFFNPTAVAISGPSLKTS